MATPPGIEGTGGIAADSGATLALAKLDPAPVPVPTAKPCVSQNGVIVITSCRKAFLVSVMQILGSTRIHPREGVVSDGLVYLYGP